MIYIVTILKRLYHVFIDHIYNRIEGDFVVYVWQKKQKNNK